MQVMKPLRAALVGFDADSPTVRELEAALRRQRVHVTRLYLEDCDNLRDDTDCVFINSRMAQQVRDNLAHWQDNSRALWIAVPDAAPEQVVDEDTGLITWGTGAASRDGLMRFETLVLDRTAGQLDAHGQMHELKEAELRLMEMLMRRPGWVVSVEDIARHCLGNENRARSCVSSLVRSLRRKVETEPGPPRWVRTVYGKGYRLASPLTGANSATGSRTRYPGGW